MSRTITIPTESVVTYNKDGIVKVDHLKKTKIPILTKKLGVKK